MEMTLKEILIEARNLELQEQIQLANQLLQWAEMKVKGTQSMQDRERRKPGLNLGSCIVTDDFDEPLPDDFWLGEI